MPTTVSAAWERETRGKHTHTPQKRGSGFATDLSMLWDPPGRWARRKASRSRQGPSRSGFGAGGTGGQGCGLFFLRHPLATYNSLHLLRPPLDSAASARDRTTTLPPRSRNPEGRRLRRVPLVPRAPQHPEARKRAWGEERAPGRGMGPGRQPPDLLPRAGRRGSGSGSAPRTRAGPVRAGSRPRPPTPAPQQDARQRLALPRVRSSGTFSSPGLSFRPARNRHIAPVTIRPWWPAVAALAPTSAPVRSTRPGPGGGKASGGCRAARGEGCSRLTSYSQVLQRKAAADRRHIDGFQSQHRKPRPIAREPLPRAPGAPPRHLSAPRHLSRLSAAAGGRQRWCRLTRGAEGIDADSGSR